MTYIFQDFDVGQVLTATEMDQVEANIRDHVHGQDSVVLSGVSYRYENKTTGFTVATTDVGKLFSCSGTFTIDLPALAGIGNGFAFSVKNRGTGPITIDGNGSETIEGQTTFILQAAAVSGGLEKFTTIYKDGTANEWKFSTSPNIGQWELVDFDTAISAASTIDFTNGRIANSTNLLLVWILETSANDTFGVQLFIDGGTTPISTGYAGIGMRLDNDTSDSNQFYSVLPTTMHVLAGDTAALFDPVAGGPQTGLTYMFNCDSTLGDSSANVRFLTTTSGTHEQSTAGAFIGGSNTGAQSADVDAIRILATSGNLTGKAWLYRWIDGN